MMRFKLPVIAAVLAASAVTAAPPKDKPVVVDAIIETTAGRIILPSSANGMLVFSECEGCPTRSLPTSSSTVYRFNERDFSLGEFRAVLSQLPKTNVNVVVSGKTRELKLLDATNETASIPAVRPARNRSK